MVPGVVWRGNLETVPCRGHLEWIPLRGYRIGYPTEGNGVPCKGTLKGSSRQFPIEGVRWTGPIKASPRGGPLEGVSRRGFHWWAPLEGDPVMRPVVVTLGGDILDSISWRGSPGGDQLAGPLEVAVGVYRGVGNLEGSPCRR